MRTRPRALARTSILGLLAGGLASAAYQALSRRHVVYKQYIPAAFEVALAVLNAHRRRLNRKRRSWPLAPIRRMWWAHAAPRC